MTLPSEPPIRSSASRRDRTPLRTCIGCRRVLPAADLYRCRLDANGSVGVEPDDRRRNDGKGRGAWLCGLECAQVAQRARAFDRAFRQRVDCSQVLDEIAAIVAPGPAD